MKNFKSKKIFQAFVLIELFLISFFLRFYFSPQEKLIYSDSEESLIVAKNFREFGTFDGRMGEDGGYFLPFFYSRIGQGILIFFANFFFQNLEHSAFFISTIFSSSLPVLTFFFLKFFKFDNLKIFFASLIVAISPLFAIWGGFIVSNSIATAWFLLAIIFIDKKIFSFFLFLTFLTRLEFVAISLFFIFSFKDFLPKPQKFFLKQIFFSLIFVGIFILLFSQNREFLFFEIFRLIFSWIFRAKFLITILAILTFFLLPEKVKLSVIVAIFALSLFLSKKVFEKEFFELDKIFWIFLSAFLISKILSFQNFYKKVFTKKFWEFLNFFQKSKSRTLKNFKKTEDKNFINLAIFAILSMLIYTPFSFTSSRYTIIFFIVLSYFISEIFSKNKIFLLLIPIWSIFSVFKLNQNFPWTDPRAFNSLIGPKILKALHEKNFSEKDFIIATSIPENFRINSNFSIWSLKDYGTTIYQKEVPNFKDLSKKRFLLIIDISTEKAKLYNKNKTFEIAKTKKPIAEIFIDRIFYLKEKSFVSNEPVRIYEISFEEFKEII